MLDAFGSGYCSLAYLGEIEFDKIKIDRSLALSAIQSKPKAIIVEMIAKLGAEQMIVAVISAQRGLRLRSCLLWTG